MDREKEREEVLQDMSKIFNPKYPLSDREYQGLYDLYDAGYRKIPEGAVVLTREEYEDLRTLSDCAVCEHKEIEQSRKETAREIFDRLMKAERGDGFVTYTWSKSTIKQFANEYGVEVEE